MLRYALALAVTVPAAAHAVTVPLTVDLMDLTPFETTLGGSVAYEINLAGLGFSSVSSVTFVDDDSVQETSGATAAFDVDAVAIGDSFGGSLITASSYDFTAGASTGTLAGTDGAGNINNAVATLETFDATVAPRFGFLSLGDGGTLTAFFDPAVVVDSSLFFLTSDVGTAEELLTLSITGTTEINPAPIPLPAGGLLLLTGLGAIAYTRRNVKA